MIRILGMHRTKWTHIGEMTGVLNAINAIVLMGEPHPTRRQYDELKELSDITLEELQQMTQARNELQIKVSQLVEEVKELRSKDLRRRISNIINSNEDLGDMLENLIVLVQDERLGSATTTSG